MRLYLTLALLNFFAPILMAVVPGAPDADPCVTALPGVKKKETDAHRNAFELYTKLSILGPTEREELMLDAYGWPGRAPQTLGPEGRNFLFDLFDSSPGKYGPDQKWIPPAIRTDQLRPWSRLEKKLEWLEANAKTLRAESLAFSEDLGAALEQRDPSRVRELILKRYPARMSPPRGALLSAVFEREDVVETGGWRFSLSRRGIAELMARIGEIEAAEFYRALYFQTRPDNPPVTSADSPKSVRPLSYAEAHRLNSGALIRASHGGGFHSVLNFLERRSPGTALMRGGRGLQVTPERPATSYQKDLVYAGRSEPFADSPCVLTFDIARGHLDSADNRYEAGLRADDIEHMTHVRLFDFASGKIYDWSPSLGLQPLTIPAAEFRREYRKAIQLSE